MNTNTLSKSVEINASKEKIWNILTEQPYLNEWTSALMPGSTVTGEVKEGADLIYSDGTNNGVVGRVAEFKPLESLRIDIVAEAKDGLPDFDNPDSKKWEGCYDHYVISENNGVTTLSMETAVPAEYFNDFKDNWSKMIDTVKEIAERP